MKSNMFAWHSIKTRVTFSTLAIFVLSLWALSYYSSRMLQDDLQRMLGEKQFSTVSLVAEQINDALLDRTNALAITAASIDAPLMGKPSDLQSWLQQRLLARSLFNGGVWICDQNGTVIASDLHSLIGANYADRAYMISVFRDNQSAISTPITGKVLQDSIFAMAVPIHDANGKVIGALAGVTDLGKPNFLDHLSQGIYGNHGGYLLAAQKDRTVIAATEKALFAQAILTAGASPMLDRYLKGYEGYGVSVNARGQQELSAAKGIPAAQWLLAFVSPTAEAFAPIHAMQQRMLWATLALTLIASAVTWWTLRRQLAPALSTIDALATLLDSNHSPHVLPVKNQDEIGDLIMGFKRLLARQRTLQDDLYATLSASPDLVFDVGLDGRYYAIHCASAELLVAPAKTLIGAKVQDQLPADAATAVLETLAEANVTGHASGKQMLLQLPSGAHWFELSAARKPALPNQAQRFIVISRDVTERMNADERVRQALASAEKANNSKSRFLAATSHDLRQPMAALALYASMLDSAVKPGQEKLVSHIQSCVDSLGGMLNDLLDVSKLDSGAMVPKITDFSVEGLCASLQSIYNSKAAKKGLRLRCRHAANLTLHTDQRMLHRLIGNLIDNAVTYTAQGGVLIGTRRHGGKLWLEVWDTGIGLPQDHIPLIFEEFRQLGDNARNRGSGLGLAIASKIAALLGLEIGVRSRPGRGSVFSVTLPEGGALASAQPPAPLGSPTFTIGLVEDNPLVMDALAQALQGLGHTVLAGTGGAQLMEQLGERVPDIMVCDYRLGAGETGLDVIAAARTRFGPQLPAIILTGETDPDLLRKMADKAIPVYFKPVPMQELQGHIRRAVERA